MDTQLPMKIIFFVVSLFLLSLVSQRIDSFRLRLFALCIQCFPWHRYAMISQLSMRSVSILYSNFSLALVR